METVHVSECSPIVLSVEANTDVGGSGNSDNTTTGFTKCKLSHCLIYREMMSKLIINIVLTTVNIYLLL